MDKKNVLIIVGIGIVVIIVLWLVLIPDTPSHPCNTPRHSAVSFGLSKPYQALLFQNGTFESHIITGSGCPTTITGVEVLYEGKHYNEMKKGVICQVNAPTTNITVLPGRRFKITATCPPVNVKDKTAYVYLTIEYAAICGNRVEEGVSCGGVCLLYDKEYRRYIFKPYNKDD